MLLDESIKLLDQGIPVHPQVSCRPLNFEFTMAEPFPFESMRLFAPISRRADLATKREVYAGGEFRREFREKMAGGRAGALGGSWDRTVVSWFPPDPTLEGTNVAALAAERAVDPSDLVLDLALESDLDARFRMAVLNYDEDEVEGLLTDPHTMLGLSDAGAHASQLCDSGFSTHLLSRWVRERKALTLEDAVRKLTSEPAEIFGITDRGLLAAGRAGRRGRVRSRHGRLLRPAPRARPAGRRRSAGGRRHRHRRGRGQRGDDPPGRRRRGGRSRPAARPAAAQRLGVTVSTPTSPTRWGDREGRRRDILEAARRQMKGGYDELNMRDIARGAGVSPGTLYQYFSTKEEIFATLYGEAIEAHTERLAPICERADDLEALLVEVATAYLDLYAGYGRYFTTWSSVMAESTADDAALPRELSLRLRAATHDQAVLVVTTMRRVASGRGRRLVDEPQAMPMLWAVLNGLADHVTSERHKLTRFSIEELIAFAARTLAAGLVTRA